MNAKENVLDRIEQTFILFKNNFKDLFLPIFIYNFLFIILIFNIFSFTFFYFYPTDYGSFNSGSIFWISTIIYTTLLISGFLLYLIFYIWIYLWLIKTIKDLYNSEKINLNQNIKYWFLNILESFKTYWNIFAYVYLIPAIILIILLIFVLLLLSQQNYELLKNIWLIVFIIFILIFFPFVLYRWIKTIFSLYSAINEDSFLKDNFLFSIKITNNNWWRIVWNMILVWMFIWLISSTFSFFINMIWSLWNNTNIWDILLNLNKLKIDDLKNIIENYNNFNIFKIISNLLKLVITTIWTIYSTIFIFIFFKRLEQESNNLNQHIIEDKVKKIKATEF